MSEQLTLEITRLQASDRSGESTYRLSGDAAFLWEELGMLLVDPLLVSLSLRRSPEYTQPDKQVSF